MKIGDRNFEGYLDFEVKSEPWNLYALEDGAVLKFKLVLIKVIPLQQEGTKNYAVNTANVVGVIVPEELKGGVSPLSKGKFQVEKKDIPFGAIEEKWGEYKLEDGTILKIKPAITSIDKAKEFDRNGEPIYMVQSQVLIKK